MEESILERIRRQAKAANEGTPQPGLTDTTGRLQNPFVSGPGARLKGGQLFVGQSGPKCAAEHYMG